MVFPASVLLCAKKMALFARLRGVALRRGGYGDAGAPPQTPAGASPLHPFPLRRGRG